MASIMVATAVVARDWSLEQPVVAIEGGDAVGLGHGGIVKGGVDEVHQRIVGWGLAHDGLTDMNDLAGVGAEAMHCKHGQGLAVKEDFEHADRLAGDLRTGEAAKLSVTDFVGNAGDG